MGREVHGYFLILTYFSSKMLKINSLETYKNYFNF